ncbi:unnamed protein product [Echinostoma caproni]|uniref:Nesprin-1-like n=1 Tax=Echinostoma caproni TaxID=27848 RepID=A0A183AWR0_9TREM|nr:unnamed protein product [Echinostoma caproni]
MQGTVATHDQAQSVEEATQQLADHASLKTELESRREPFAQLISYGRCITEGETDEHYVELDERLDALETGWSELVRMWIHRQKQLEDSLSIQVGRLIFIIAKSD